MTPGELSAFNEFLELLKEHRDTDFGSSLLVGLCKDFDLRAPELRPVLEELATWIELPSSDLRRELVFALCFFRPVAGFEWVIARGWVQAPPDDLHWYASAVELACTGPDRVPKELLHAIVGTLLTGPPPGPEAPAGDSFAADVARLDYRRSQVEAVRAMRHLTAVVLPEHRWDERQPVDWECVTRILHRVFSA